MSWSEGAEPGRARRRRPAPTAVDRRRRRPSSPPSSRATSPPRCSSAAGPCRADALVDASRVANATGAKLLAETFPARLERGAGRVPVDRLAYLAEFAAMQLDGLQHLVVVDAKSPVSFFAYPGKASDLVPEGCKVHVLAGAPTTIAGAALAALADAVGAAADAATVQAAGPPRAAHRPAHRRRRLPGARRAAARGRHRLRRGQHVGPVRRRRHRRRARPRLAHASPAAPSARACPLAVGAAVACPDRKVIALAGRRLRDVHDAGAVDAWPARSSTSSPIIFNNRSYAVLNMELSRVGRRGRARRPRTCSTSHRPDLDFVALATGLGVPATRATTAEEFIDQLRAALATTGPTVIEAIVPSII